MASPPSTPGLGAALTPPPGWWQASDGKWYAPELHPDYARSVAVGSSSTPLAVPPLYPTQPGVVPSLTGPTESKKKKWVWLTGAVAIVVALLISGLLIGSHASPPKTLSATGSLQQPDPSAELRSVALQYEQYRGEFVSNGKQPGAEISQADSDIQTQVNRIATDQTTYNNNEFGTGCSFSDLTGYSTCLAQEQQTAAGAQADETAAQAAAKNDQSELAAAYQQDASVISTFVQQLDSVAWPTPLTRQDSSQLEQSLTDLRTAVNQSNSDLLSGQSIVQDNQSMSVVISDLQTEFINLASALGVPPPQASP